jgi:hypothetical protein
MILDRTIDSTFDIIFKNKTKIIKYWKFSSLEKLLIKIEYLEIQNLNIILRTYFKSFHSIWGNFSNLSRVGDNCWGHNVSAILSKKSYA